MKANPRESEGARLERKAFLSYLRREFNKYNSTELKKAIDWVLGRHARYDSKKGGLGK